MSAIAFVRTATTAIDISCLPQTPVSDRDALLLTILTTTPVPLSAPEICHRMNMMDDSRDWCRAESSLRSTISQSDWIVRLKGHGYWHRGRNYPHANWIAETRFALLHIEGHGEPLRELRRQLQRLHGNWSELGLRRRYQIVHSRLPQLWVDGGCSMEDLLDTTLRCILETADRPLNTEDFRVSARRIGVPKSALSLVTYRSLKAKWWADIIRLEGFWRLDRPAPDGMASPDNEILEATRALLEESGEFLTAEYLVEHLSHQGIVVSVSNADKCMCLRKIIKEIEGVESRPQRGFRIPKARPKLRAPNWKQAHAVA